MKKIEMKARCKSILNSGIKSVSDKNDFDFLINVFSMHTEWEMKSLGFQPIKEITIKYSRQGTKCFYIRRADNSEVDISYLHCIYPKSDDGNLQAACREAIRPIVESFLNRQCFPMICPIENTIIKTKDDAEVDHFDMDFIEVYKKWVDLNGGVSKLIGYVNKTDGNGTVTCFINDEIKEDFIKFHNAHSHLRILSTKANRSTRKKK